MGNKTSIGFGLALLLVVGAVVFRFGLTDTAQIEAAKKAAHDHEHHDHAGHDHSGHDHHDHFNQTTPAEKVIVVSTGITEPRMAPPLPQQNSKKGNTGNPHLDQLSPEMRQAIRDKLLLNGPMETIEHPDGTIELPSNGRFTQMPVAVRMPDGTLEVREYSQIPEEK